MCRGGGGGGGVGGGGGICPGLTDTTSGFLVCVFAFRLLSWCFPSEFSSCVKVEVDVLGSPP